MPCSQLSQLAATPVVELAGGCPSRISDHMFLSVGNLQSPCMVCFSSSLTAAETLGGDARWHGSRPAGGQIPTLYSLSFVVEISDQCRSMSVGCKETMWQFNGLQMTQNSADLHLKKIQESESKHSKTVSARGTNGHTAVVKEGHSQEKVQIRKNSFCPPLTLYSSHRSLTTI